MFQYFILALVAAASANVYHDGACPEVKVVDNFDWSNYKGIWYEQAKYPNEIEKFGKCGWAEYIPEGEGVKVKNGHIIQNKEYLIEGSARPAGAKNVGKILHKLTYGGVTRENLLNILATDNKNFYIGYFCKYDEEKKGHQDFAWVLTKSKTLDGEVKTAIDNYLQGSTVIDNSKLQYNDFSDDACTIKK
ncbi:bilin-binding protein-like [Leptidea sinapis]|uniref:bilin-binding protein-like n=1 Tax=Leptidea sinapis TaxID=189913 RepID=UPI0021341755|nr:bilin-binding protein-like [Leptidea sinapis]